MLARLIDTDGPDAGVVAEKEFEDPQDALRFLWDEAEKADHDRGKLVGELDGNAVTL
jgi:hypothetical protein